MNEEQNNNQTVDKNVYSTELNYPPKSKLKLVLFIVGGLILLGGLLYLIFFSGIFTKKDTSPDAGGAQVDHKIDGQKTTFPSLRIEDDDLDNDGLLDSEEEKLGTSNEEFDTDFDGIPDKMEVEQYKTDPTKFDTDGDGFGDGYEIINGYNPLGAGRL